MLGLVKKIVLGWIFYEVSNKFGVIENVSTNMRPERKGWLAELALIQMTPLLNFSLTATLNITLILESFSE